MCGFSDSIQSTAAQIAGAVWDEPQASHVTGGTYGVGFVETEMIAGGASA